MIFNTFFSLQVKQRKPGFCPGGESPFTTANGDIPVYIIINSYILSISYYDTLKIHTESVTLTLFVGTIYI